MVKPSIFCLMGPTASGKTQLAIELVQQFPFEIISVDSAMIYRGMDIGTSKPDLMTLQKAPHRLIDIRDPAEIYSAAQFREDALKEMHAIFANNKIPLLVGGTMLYFRALQNGLSDLPSADATVREKINKEAIEKGWPAIHEYLTKIDPDSAKRIHPHDSQRIQRALEVFELTGKTLTQCQLENRMVPNHLPIHNIGLIPNNRQILHARIAERFQKMLTDGLLEEVQQLFARGDLNLMLPSIRSVGYRQIWEYLLGDVTYAEMTEKAIIATRQLAKRQLTWLRSWNEVTLIDSESQDLNSQVITIIENKLT